MGFAEKTKVRQIPGGKGKTYIYNRAEANKADGVPEASPKKLSPKSFSVHENRALFMQKPCTFWKIRLRKNVHRDNFTINNRF